MTSVEKVAKCIEQMGLSDLFLMDGWYDCLKGKPGRYGSIVIHEDGTLTTDPIRVPFQIETS